MQVYLNNSKKDSSITIDTSLRKNFLIQSKRENFPKGEIVKIDSRGEVTVRLFK